MLLTIHNLPLGTVSKDVKELLLAKCGLKDLILDNLEEEGSGMKVTVGLAEEEEAAILTRMINGLYFHGQQLYVQDVRKKRKPAENQYHINAKQIKAYQPGQMVPPPIVPVAHPGGAPRINPGVPPPLNPGLGSLNPRTQLSPGLGPQIRGVAPPLNPGGTLQFNPRMVPTMNPLGPQIRGVAPPLNPGLGPQVNRGLAPPLNPGVPPLFRGVAAPLNSPSQAMQYKYQANATPLASGPMYNNSQTSNFAPAQTASPVPVVTPHAGQDKGQYSGYQQYNQQNQFVQQNQQFGQQNPQFGQQNQQFGPQSQFGQQSQPGQLFNPMAEINQLTQQLNQIKQHLSQSQQHNSEAPGNIYNMNQAGPSTQSQSSFQKNPTISASATDNQEPSRWDNPNPTAKAHKPPLDTADKIPNPSHISPVFITNLAPVKTTTQPKQQMENKSVPKPPKLGSTKESLEPKPLKENIAYKNVLQKLVEGLSRPDAKAIKTKHYDNLYGCVRALTMRVNQNTGDYNKCGTSPVTRYFSSEILMNRLVSLLEHEYLGGAELMAKYKAVYSLTDDLKLFYKIKAHYKETGQLPTNAVFEEIPKSDKNESGAMIETTDKPRPNEGTSQTAKSLNWDNLGPRIPPSNQNMDNNTPRRDYMDSYSPGRDTNSRSRESSLSSDDDSPRTDNKRPTTDNKSLTRVNTSPRRDSISPKRENKSPRRDNKSPRRDHKSPRRDNKSPRRDNKSPRRDNKSPRRDNESPRRDNKSPRRGNKSPRKDSTSHSRDSSQSRDLKSPRRDIYKRRDNNSPTRDKYKRRDNNSPARDKYKRRDDKSPTRDKYKRRDNNSPTKDKYKRRDKSRSRDKYSPKRDNYRRRDKTPNRDIKSHRRDDYSHKRDKSPYRDSRKHSSDNYHKKRELTPYREYHRKDKYSKKDISPLRYSKYHRRDNYDLRRDLSPHRERENHRRDNYYHKRDNSPKRDNNYQRRDIHRNKDNINQNSFKSKNDSLDVKIKTESVGSLIPKYPNGDMREYTEVLDGIRKETLLLPYNIDRTEKMATLKEVGDVAKIIQNICCEFIEKGDADIQMLFKRNCLKTFLSYTKQFLLMFMSKRLTKSGPNVLKIRGALSSPRRMPLQNFLLKHGCLSAEKVLDLDAYMSSRQHYIRAIFPTSKVTDYLAGKNIVEIGEEPKIEKIIITYSFFDTLRTRPDYFLISDKKNDLFKYYEKTLFDADNKVNLLDKDWPMKKLQVKLQEENKVKLKSGRNVRNASGSSVRKGLSKDLVDKVKANNDDDGIELKVTKVKEEKVAKVIDNVGSDYVLGNKEETASINAKDLGNSDGICKKEDTNANVNEVTVKCEASDDNNVKNSNDEVTASNNVELSHNVKHDRTDNDNKGICNEDDNISIKNELIEEGEVTNVCNAKDANDEEIENNIAPVLDKGDKIDYDEDIISERDKISRDIVKTEKCDASDDYNVEYSNGGKDAIKNENETGNADAKTENFIDLDLSDGGESMANDSKVTDCADVKISNYEGEINRDELTEDYDQEIANDGENIRNDFEEIGNVGVDINNDDEDIGNDDEISGEYDKYFSNDGQEGNEGDNFDVDDETFENDDEAFGNDDDDFGNNHEYFGNDDEEIGNTSDALLDDNQEEIDETENMDNIDEEYDEEFQEENLEEEEDNYGDIEDIEHDEDLEAAWGFKTSNQLDDNDGEMEADDDDDEYSQDNTEDIDIGNVDDDDLEDY